MLLGCKKMQVFCGKNFRNTSWLLIFYFNDEQLQYVILFIVLIVWATVTV